LQLNPAEVYQMPVNISFFSEGDECAIVGGASTYKLDKDEAERINKELNARQNEIIQDHWKLNQGAFGCCGFAAVLMSLLELNVGKFENLYDVFFHSKLYQQNIVVDNSNKITERLKRRWTKLDQSMAPWGSFDLNMCMGLMILLKEYDKVTGVNLVKEYGEIWKECYEYSQLFPSWIPGEKVNKMPSTEHFVFSYKQGDLALSIQGMQKLLQLVYENKYDIQEVTIVDNNKLKMIPSNSNERGLDRFLGKFWAIVQQKKLGLGQMGAILGLANNNWVNNSNYSKFSYISHWIYVPYIKPPTAWTWGQEYNLDDLLVKSGYTAKYAIYISKPNNIP